MYLWDCFSFVLYIPLSHFKILHKSENMRVYVFLSFLFIGIKKRHIDQQIKIESLGIKLCVRARKVT